MSIVLAVCLGLLLVPAVVGVSAGAGDPPEPALGKAAFRMPAEVEVTPGQAFDVAVTIYNPDNINMYSAGMDVLWSHPSLLNVAAIDGSEWTTYLDSGWDNDTGEAWYVAGGSIASPFISTANITHCVVHFVAGNADGVTTVNFTPETYWSETVMYDVNTDDLTDWSAMQNMTVKIGAGGLPPRISANPSSLTFNAIEGGDPPNQTLELCHSGAGTLDWSLTDGDTAWLSESSTSGSLDEGVCEDVTVSVDVTGMEAGDYGAIITIIGSAAVEVPVSLHIESAAPVGPAHLSASSLNISPQQVEPDEQVTISINVANIGGETGSYNAVLYINDVVEDSQTVSVAGGTSKNVIFTVSKSQAGVYDVSLAGQSGQFEVVGGGWSGGGLGTGGIIAIVVVVIALIVVLVLIMRRTRRPE